jgi:hypothetical protein
MPIDDKEWEIAMDKVIIEQQDERIAELYERLKASEVEVELLKDVLRIKGYRESCSIPGCNCGEHGWIHGGYADDRLREIRDALDEDCQDKTLLEAVITLKAHTWQQERAAVVAWISGNGDHCHSVFEIADRLRAGEHWPEGGTP